ncbi:GNAT family N-acetyltransferase [Laspinema olomoucense]|uniref:GNAT family N-acetyltransferase n=1 Tax=Laspinema olomoucense TaxID=3231600 RepID=UPI0021BAB18E|nr:GNAT family N-acetyltransferase [Laspinema sp. D3d]MCT7973438.1 GNAT family N-acetyltransferase [Laspinema sp. D3d]
MLPLSVSAGVVFGNVGGDGFVQPLAAASIIAQQTWIEPEPEWLLLDWQLLDEFGLAPDCGYLADLGVAATYRRQGIASELVRLGWRQYPDKPMLLRVSA